MNTRLFRSAVITSVIFLCVSSAVVQASAINTVWDLKGKCLSATALNGETCNGYIEGIVRGYFATIATLKNHNIQLPFFCGPSSEPPDILNNEAYIRSYILNHPSDNQREAEIVIFEALREKYGCKD
jgi:hypothetical protein